MSTDTPVQSFPETRAPTRVKHTIVGVFAQYIQDLTRPVDPLSCATCP